MSKRQFGVQAADVKKLLKRYNNTNKDILVNIYAEKIRAAAGLF